MFAAFRIVDIREGGAVCAGVVLEGDAKRVKILLEDGREVRVAAPRVLDDSGRDIPNDRQTKAQLKTQLRDWREAAEARSKDVDLASLHALFVEQSAGDGARNSDALSLGELALLSLGEDNGSARAAVHRALASPNAYFKFSGRRWTLRSAEDVAKEVQRLEAAQTLARERAEFTRAAKERLQSGKGELPAECDKFVRLIRDVAVAGEAAKSRKEATALVAEIESRQTPEGLLSESRAFDIMVKLGLFSPDENLPLLRAAVRQVFPDEVLAEAEELALLPFTAPDESPPRTDLRDLEIVTIDDVSTTEVDDGLSLQETKKGLILGIHIADAAHFVPVGSLVDEEARERGTTYYLPGHSLPMLPSVIAEGAASLVEGEDRPAISFLITLTPHLEILDAEIVRSIIRVSERMSYEDCEAVLTGERAQPAWLHALLELAEELASDRHANGATTIRAPELSFEFDEEGLPIPTLLDPGRPARRLVSEMMILANKLAAEYCKSRSLSAIYRKQGPPSGNAAPPPIDHYDSVAVNAFRRTLQRTVVSLEPGPHSGLGLPAYVQATSPIRRYQDLALHRLMKASMTGSATPHSREDVMDIAASTERTGRLARKVENETDDYWVLRYLEGKKGEVLSGMVIRADARRTHVELNCCAHRVSIPARPDHSAGDELMLKVQTVNPRMNSVSFTQE